MEVPEMFYNFLHSHLCWFLWSLFINRWCFERFFCIFPILGEDLTPPMATNGKAFWHLECVSAGHFSEDAYTWKSGPPVDFVVYPIRASGFYTLQMVSPDFWTINSMSPGFIFERPILCTRFSQSKFKNWSSKKRCQNLLQKRNLFPTPEIRFSTNKKPIPWHFFKGFL